MGPDSPRRLARSLTRFLGPAEAADALRAAGNRVLRESAGRARGTVVVLIVIALVGVATTVVLPAALAAVIDAAVAGEGVPSALGLLAVVIAAATAVDALDDLVGSYLGSSITARLRHRLLNRALVLGAPGRRRFPTGDLLSRLAVNADAPATFLPLLLSAGTMSLTAIGGVVGLALIDWRLAVTLLLGVPAAMVLIRLFLVKAGEPFLRYQQLQSAIMTRLLDAFSGVRTIRAGGTADQEIARVLEPLPELHATGRQVWLLQGQATWRLALLAPMVQVLVLAVAGFALADGSITAGQMIAAVSYVTLALAAIGLADALVSLLGCQVGAGRVGEVLDTEPAVGPPRQPLPVPPGPGRLELRGVSVRVDGRAVLDRLSLSVPAGASVAVVGRSGTGKSLLVSLLGRLLDPDEGTVCLDGTPVSRLELPALRRTVTYAFERPALLGATVHDMIAYSRPEASRAEVQAATAVAQADRFVRLLPDGYDTPLAQAPMSGGELQRLGLARAVLTDARVIVLDDATSSLDTATEVKVVEALERVLAGRTSVVVAHRAATAARADLVAWLDGGRIRMLAPHRVLWSDP
ncbi:MAG: ABC transporter ATP-binding protein, partial [Pseudonocardia sp.]